MKAIFTCLFFYSVLMFSQEDLPATVDSVDLSRYSGTWYEISKIPNSFQDHCIKNTTAKYELTDDGEIIVTNSCVDEDGEMDSSTGLARVVDKKSNSKLEVSFVSLFGWQLFWGDYWILGLSENYKYAVIGTPSKKYGWILSRTPNLNDDDLETCYQILERNGYSRDDFELSLQD